MKIEFTDGVKVASLNPNTWPDPDDVGQAEYRAIHEHALDVWKSAEGNTAERNWHVRNSLAEMQEIIAGLLEAPKRDRARNVKDNIAALQQALKGK